MRLKGLRIMSAKHTPGDWRLSAGKTGVVDQNGILIASAQYNSARDPRGVRSMAEQAANARLIAAAPALLAALEDCVNYWAAGAPIPPRSFCAQDILAAIAKAKGNP